jgi:hypothetical protein
MFCVSFNNLTVLTGLAVLKESAPSPSLLFSSGVLADVDVVDLKLSNDSTRYNTAIMFASSSLRPHKKNSWLASSPAHKKGPAQDFFLFFILKNPTFVDERL